MNAHFAEAAAPDHHEILDGRKSYPLVIYQSQFVESVGRLVDSISASIHS